MLAHESTRILGGTNQLYAAPFPFYILLGLFFLQIVLTTCPRTCQQVQMNISHSYNYSIICFSF